VLAEIETDKATVEVESSYTGTVRKHLVDEGAIVPVNDPIAVVGEPEEEIDYQSLLGEEQVAEAATAEQPAREQAERAEKGTEKAPAAAQARPQEAAPVKEEPRVSGDGHLPEGVRASPVARRMAEERGINLRDVDGSGPGGRIVKADIEAYEEAPAEVKQPVARLAPAVPAVTREDQVIPLSRLRATIGRRMAESIQQAPHFYVTHEYDVGELMDLRKQVNEKLSDQGKISVNDFIIKAVALTLREFPNLNAAINVEKKEVVHFGRINIGVAVAVENGLLTVVCQDTDMKSLRQISQEVRAMAERAREGKVRPSDIEGSTFSVSNLGMFDVENFSAIINPPEAGILAVGSARQVPVILDGQVAAGWRMKMTLSVDHRVSDGAEGARFMQALAKYIEEPLVMLV
jgi:pyruvate dehydrogenase E2 component (dihydrolipoamide acetyltransferase)